MYLCMYGCRGDGVSEQVKKQVVDSMHHYCHKGVIHAARELSMQLDNLAEDESAEQALIDCASFKEIGGMSTFPPFCTT